MPASLARRLALIVFLGTLLLIILIAIVQPETRTIEMGLMAALAVGGALASMD